MKKNLFYFSVLTTLFLSFHFNSFAAILEVGTGKPYSTIQSAIDAANPGDIIKVYPGNYSEFAINRTVVTSSGPQGTYQFGLFFDAAKPNITVMGVNAAGSQITDPLLVAANVELNATNNFGPSGVFVNADKVTITGLNLYEADGDQNKTIEVIGDDFTLKFSRITDGMSVYINDWSFNSISNTSHIRKYRIEKNRFENGTSLDIASGAGYSGGVGERKILNNFFDGNYFGDTAYWALISFNGSNTGVPWFVYPVGGAQINGNTFINSEQYIRHRGTVNNNQFNWSDYWSSNSFDHGVITLTSESPFTPETYSYSTDYTFNNVRRIGGLIQSEIDMVAQNGDIIKAGQGTFRESILVNKQVVIKGVKSGVLAKSRTGAESIIDPNVSDAHGFKIVANNVTIEGFTITNTSDYPASERYGVLTIEKIGGGQFSGIKVNNNRIHRQFKGIDFNNTDNFEIQGNWISGENNTYNYGSIWVDDYGTSSSNGLIKNNDLDGYASAVEIQGDLTHPVSNVNISENRSQGSQYVLFGLQNSQVYRNTVLNVTVGSHIYIGGGNNNVVISENFFDNGSFNGIRVADAFGAGINSNLTIVNNRITGHNSAGYFEINVSPAAYSGNLMATCNWFGTLDPDSKISGPVTYKPYLISGADQSPAPGFQPVPNSCSGYDFITCGKNNEDVIVCHNGQEKCVKLNALQGHTNHGDVMGHCPPSSRGIFITSVEPEDFKLYAAPNPLSNSTKIVYEVPQQSKINITLFDPMGRVVAVLVDGTRDAGSYTYQLDASKFAAGIYYYKMTALSGTEKFIQGQKLVIMK
jgi:hypothetical protein